MASMYLDVWCTGMAQGTLVQKQRFQILGLAIGQQQGIIFGEVPPFLRPGPGPPASPETRPGWLLISTK
jgi:hypothetical protein